MARMYWDGYPRSISVSNASDVLSVSPRVIRPAMVTGHTNPTFLKYYSVTNKIGSGGFGSCYKVVDKSTDHLFAAKIQDSDRGSREYKIHSLLRNEHVAQVVRFLDDRAGQSCMVMQLYHSDLGQLLKSRPYKRISFYEAQNYIQQLVSGLKYVHGQYIVHRDLKPVNLLLDKNNILKICDFGLAMRVPCRRESSGTLWYMAPEVLEHLGCSYAVDIWAVGVILYEMVFGHRPFRGTTKQIKSSILYNEYVIPSTAPGSVETLITNLLDGHSGRRPSLDDILVSDFLLRAAETIQA